MGKLAFYRLLNIQKCLLEIADLRTIAEQTLYTCGPCGCGAKEFNFRCGFAEQKKYLRLPALLNIHTKRKP